jgi:hypothetical protein
MSLKSNKKEKPVIYPSWIRFTNVETGEEYSLLTQLYKIGVYGIWNNDSGRQGVYKPKKLAELKKYLIKDKEVGLVKNLEFGRDVKVIKDEDGLWKEIAD